MSVSSGSQNYRKRNEESGAEWTTIQNMDSSVPSNSKQQSFRLKDNIQLDLDRAFRAAQVVKKQGKKIIEKQKQSKSKNLPKCKREFEKAFNDLKAYVETISDGLDSSESDRPSTKISYRGGGSLNLPREKQRPALCKWCEQKEEQINDLSHELTRNKKLFKQNEETLGQVLASKEEQEENLRRLEKQSALLKQQCQTEADKNRRLEEQFAILKQQLQTEKDMKDDALRRLSAMASSKLRDNNPNITDLSDQNRPTKIAEKLSELYDNQWTDAFDALQKDGKEDIKIIQELLDMLIHVFNECSRLARDRFFERVQGSIEFPGQGEHVVQSVDLPDQLKQQVKEFRRVRAAKVIEEIKKVVLQNLGLVNQSNEIQPYLTQCVEIGWLAAVQDPPLALCGKSTDKFDTNVFKDYTQRGPYVEYVVWPALLLHENGPMLAKGVAQGCSVKQTPRDFNSNPQASESSKRRQRDTADAGSSAPKQTKVSPRGATATSSKPGSATGNQITTLYCGGSKTQHSAV